MVNQATRQQFESAVIPRLRALGRRLRTYALLDGLAILFPAVIACILITLLIDRAFRLDWDMRLVQLSSLLAALTFIVWRWVWSPLRVPMTDTDLALLVERKHPQLRSRLISAVEFTSSGVAAVNRSPALIDAVVREAEGDVRGLRFHDTLAHARARKQAAVTFGSVALVALITLGARPTMAIWFERNVLLRNVEWPQRNRLSVERLQNGKLLVARGDDVTLSAVVDAGYETPRQVFMEYRGESGLAGREQMPAVMGQAGRPGRRAANSFTYTFERIEETLRCRISGGDARTDWFTVEVVDRPRIDQVLLAVTPPAYTKAERYELRAGQTVAEALKGSRIHVQIRTNKPVVEARLLRQTGGASQELGDARSLSDLDFTAEDTPTGTASYEFFLRDALDFTNLGPHTAPLRISVRLIPDKPPGVKMRVRGVGEMITTEAVLPVEVDFTDAYGLASAGVVYELARKEAAPVVEPIDGFEPGTKTFARSFDWQVARRKLVEGDRLTLRAEARDFDDVSGPNIGQSNAVTLRVVSRDELLAELNRREQEYRQDYERLLRQQEELYGEFLSLSRPAADRNADRTKSFGLLARRQRDHAGRLNAIRLQFEQVLSELQVNQLSNPTVEARLGGGIVEPMSVVSRTRMPAAADGLDALARDGSAAALESAKSAQAAILAEMNRILANMQKWEGYQEAISLLREVLKMQGDLNQETEKRVEAEIFGTEPATQPSN